MVYLELTHGRRTLEEDMDGFGEEGPVFGPYKFSHETYGTSVVMVTPSDEEHCFTVEDGLVFYNEWFYGDWFVYSDEELNNGIINRIEEFSSHKSTSKSTNRNMGGW